MSLAALRRRLVVGTEVAVVENPVRPETVGHRRRVARVQTNAVAFKPDEWDDAEMERRGGSWLYWPKAGDVAYEEGAETFTVFRKGQGLTFRFLQAWELGAVERRDELGRLVVEMATCGTCGRAWNDALITSRTPAPAARCPFEELHAAEHDGELVVLGDADCGAVLRMAGAARAIARQLDGRVWSACDDLEQIADTLRAAGLAVREPGRDRAKEIAP